MKLEGKVALVTGSSQGIGQASAIRLAQEGAKIVSLVHEDLRRWRTALELSGAISDDAIRIHWLEIVM